MIMCSTTDLVKVKTVQTTLALAAREIDEMIFTHWLTNNRKKLKDK